MKTEPSDLVDYNPIAQQATGLTKREHFASMAMQGILAGLHGSKEVMKAFSKKCDEEKEEPVDYIANMSIEYADALIQALNK